jgi:hypothetical protein
MDELLALPVATHQSVRDVLDRQVIVLITHGEHERLRKAGFGSALPDGCTDFRARYSAVVPPVEIVPNS